MNYQKIYKCDLANGVGVRVSLFVSGCGLKCKDCFNQEAWDYNAGSPYTVDTHKKICELIELDYVDGLSILGGDPLCRDESDIEQLIYLAMHAKMMGKTVWMWTGFTWEYIWSKGSPEQQQLVRLCDVLIDGPFEADKKDLSLYWRGSTNQRIIDVQNSLVAKCCIEYI